MQDPNRNSNRPYQTVERLAVTLGMKPEEDERSVTDGGVFDNTFKKTHYKAGRDLCLLHMVIMHKRTPPARLVWHAPPRT